MKSSMSHSHSVRGRIYGEPLGQKDGASLYWHRRPHELFHPLIYLVGPEMEHGKNSIAVVTLQRDSPAAYGTTWYLPNTSSEAVLILDGMLLNGEKRKSRSGVREEGLLTLCVETKGRMMGWRSMVSIRSGNSSPVGPFLRRSSRAVSVVGLVSGDGVPSSSSSSVGQEGISGSTEIDGRYDPLQPFVRFYGRFDGIPEPILIYAVLLPVVANRR